MYFKRFDEAETLYHKMDRPDLAIDMRMRWGAVKQPQGHEISAVVPPFYSTGAARRAACLLGAVQGRGSWGLSAPTFLACCVLQAG